MVTLVAWYVAVMVTTLIHIRQDSILGFHPQDSVSVWPFLASLSALQLEGAHSNFGMTIHESHRVIHLFFFGLFVRFVFIMAESLSQVSDQ